MRAIAWILLVGLGWAGAGAEGRETSGADRAMESIQSPAIRAHMAFLSDDLLEGRGMGTRGYLLAARYVADQFEAMGLEPAGEGRTYFQAVPLRQALLDESGSAAALVGDREEEPLIQGRDLLLSRSVVEENAGAEDPLVYVGYGVTAPEFGYDDYTGLDVRGKILVMLRGAPPRFPHNERAYYSDFDVKYRNAVIRGAVGVISLRTPEGEKQFPFEKSGQLARMPSMGWVAPDGTLPGVFPEIRVGAFLSAAGTAKVFAGSPHSLDEVFTAAAESRALSFDLPKRARFRIRNRISDLHCTNVAALLPGSDPKLRSEVVLYTAHLDHLGMDETLAGDTIYNGAYDNASGVAIMLEVARALASLPRAPRRSILFLVVTGEEMGLLGSEYFAAYPTVPAKDIVADVNLDEVLMLHPCLDVVAFGAEHSTLAGYVERAATRMGIKVTPDPWPEEIIFVRSDQYSFVKKGIPSVYLVPGPDAGKSGPPGSELEDAWDRDYYHSPRDDMNQPMDFEAGVTFARLNLALGLDLADGPERPRWNPGDFFGERFGAAGPDRKPTTRLRGF